MRTRLNTAATSLPAGVTALFVAVVVGVPGALGQYGEATHLGHAPGDVAHWTLTNAYLLLFSLGIAIVPGALFGLGYMLGRPRNTFERPLATFAVTTTALFVGQAALIGAGEASRPLERYVFYVTPLLFLAFFAYAERGSAVEARVRSGRHVPRRIALSLVSLPGLTGTGAFFFDSVTLSAFARVSCLQPRTSKTHPSSTPLVPIALAPVGLRAAAPAPRRA